MAEARIKWNNCVADIAFFGFISQALWRPLRPGNRSRGELDRCCSSSGHSRRRFQFPWTSSRPRRLRSALAIVKSKPRVIRIEFSYVNVLALCGRSRRKELLCSKIAFLERCGAPARLTSSRPPAPNRTGLDFIRQFQRDCRSLHPAYRPKASTSDRQSLRSAKFTVSRRFSDDASLRQFPRKCDLWP